MAGSVANTLSIEELEMHLEILCPRKTVLIEGPHGIGKTEWAIDYGVRNGFKVKVWHPSHAVDGSDVSGLPNKNYETKTTELFPPEWLKPSDNQKVLLIIDETNRAIGLVQNAIMQLTNNGTFDNVSLPEGSRIFALINPAGDGRYEVSSFDDAQEDRYWRCSFLPSHPEWFKWMRVKGDADERVIRYLEKYTNNIDPYDNEDMVGANTAGNNDGLTFVKRPSRRSWYQCATDIKRGEAIGMWNGVVGRARLINHVAGYVGMNLAIDYATWHEQCEVFDINDLVFGNGVDEAAAKKINDMSINEMDNSIKFMKSVVGLFAGKSNEFVQMKKDKNPLLKSYAKNLVDILEALDPEPRTTAITTLLVPELEAGKKWLVAMTNVSKDLTGIITDSQSELDKV